MRLLRRWRGVAHAVSARLGDEVLLLAGTTLAAALHLAVPLLTRPPSCGSAGPLLRCCEALLRLRGIWRRHESATLQQHSRPTERTAHGGRRRVASYAEEKHVAKHVPRHGERGATPLRARLLRIGTKGG